MGKKGIVIAVIIAAIAIIGLIVFLKPRPEPPTPVIPPPAEPKVIKIGVIAPLTGDAAIYGSALKKGMDLALEEINGKGGINGAKLTLIYEDRQVDQEEEISKII